MQDATFDELADLAMQRSGQFIPKSKSYLIEARLSAIARREGFGSMDDLVHTLKARGNAVFAAEVAAALVSKETWFFRDRHALTQAVQEVLPARLKASNTGRLKVWCAGGATGQEAYSLAIMLTDNLPVALRGARIDILSTDICKSVTEHARKAQYGHFDIQRGLSIHRVLAHFKRQETGQWEALETLRNAVSFRQHNLMEDASGLGQHDVILCRHVLSGMARPVRGVVAERLAKQLAPGGVLLLGEGESLTGLTKALEPARNVRGGWVVEGTANAAAA